MSQWLQRLKNFSQQYLNFQPDEEGPLDPDSPRAEASEAVQPLTERDYEFLFSQLLEGVAHGWSPERVQRFFEALGDRSSPEAWQAWLQRYGAKVLAATTPSSDLAQRLIAFGDQAQELPAWRLLGEAAQGIGRLLLESEGGDRDTWDAGPAPRTPPPPPETPVPEPEAPEPSQPVVATPAAPASSEPVISLEELLGRLQQDQALVQQLAQRLGLMTQEPQAIIQELVRQIEQRQASTAAASSASPHAAAAEQAFNQGVQQYESGDFAGAIARWEQAINLKPDYHQAWGNRGLGLKNLGRYEEAIASYDRALELKPDFFKAWYNRGLALDELGRHEEAIASYDEVIKLKPDFHKAWYSRAHSLEQVGSRGEALESYGKALELQPTFHKAWLGQAAGYERAGRFSEAVISYDGALRLKPEEADTWAQRGACLVAAGAAREAIASYDRALELRPQDPTLMWRRGDARAAADDWSAALADYAAALAIQPDLAGAWCSRGRALAALGQWDEALAAYDQALTLEPSLARAWQQRGDGLAAQGSLAEALTSYDKAIRLQPDNPTAWAGRGRVLVALGQPEAAIGSYDKALQLQADDWQLWAGRSAAAQQSAQPDLLITSLSAIAQSDPVLNQRGIEGEIAGLEQGLQRLPAAQVEGRGRLQWLLGRARYRQGQALADPAPRWRQALQHYEQALALLQPEAQPLAHLEVLQDCVAVHLSLEEVEEAQRLQQQGLARLQDLLHRELPPEAQRQLVLTLAPLQQFGVDIAVQMGEFGLALEKAEQGKAIALSWLIEQPTLGQALPSWEAIQRLCRPRTALVVWHLSPAALTTFIVRSGVSEPIVLGRTPNVVLNVVLSPSLRARVNSARENSETSLDILLELLGLGNEGEATPAAPISPSRPEATVDEVAEARERRQRLTTWFDAWEAAQGAEEAANTEVLPDLLTQLGEILNLEGLLSELEQAGVETVLLVPHQELRRLPLATLFPEHLTVASVSAAKLALPQGGLLSGGVSEPWLQEPGEVDWAVTVGQPQTPTGERSLLLIAGPDHQTADGSPLPLPAGADLEAAAIAQYCGTFERLAGDQVTRAAVQAALASGHRLLHYLGYATENRQTPAQSALQLSGRDRLLSRDGDDLPWSNYYLVSFSLPATPLGQGSAADTADLATALLSRGVGYVLSALWPTASEARLLLVVDFYRRFLRGLPPPQALRQAQSWLQRARSEALAQWYQERAGEMAAAPGNLAQEFQGAATRWQAQPGAATPPYAHPHYWAGFGISARNTDWLR